MPIFAPLNQIFYGPPGTGKTYEAQARAVAIIEKQEEMHAPFPSPWPRAVLRQKFAQYQREGRIVMVTFHPAFGYEDFVEGIKPRVDAQQRVTYAIEDGVFKRLCYEATFRLLRTAVPARPADLAPDFERLYFDFLVHVRQQLTVGTFALTTRQGRTVEVLRVTPRQHLRVRYAGSTRRYTVSRDRLSQLADRLGLPGATPAATSVREVIGPTSSALYEAVWQSLSQFARPYRAYQAEVSAAYDPPEYEGVVNEPDYAQRKQQVQGTDGLVAGPDAERFVLVIDELNRGPVATIFGELITLLEADKRTGAPEALRVVLPYSRQLFGVPPNLYIIGTMNTADRHTAPLDVALRRRFAFVEMPPRPELLAWPAGTSGQPPLAELLRTLNQRLAERFDGDHQLGHAYLWEVRHDPTPWERLRIVFAQQIIPLLREYCFDQPDVMSELLGEGFFSEMGQGIDYGRMDDEKFRKAIKDVLSTP